MILGLEPGFEPKPVPTARFYIPVTFQIKTPPPSNKQQKKNVSADLGLATSLTPAAIFCRLSTGNFHKKNKK